MSSEARRIPPSPAELDLRIEWSGEPYLDVYVRRSAHREIDWTLYTHVAFPAEQDTGLYRIEFTAERFDGLTEAWVERQFDRAKAERKLADAGR